MRTIRTKSEGIPNDKFVTRAENLVYCDNSVNTFNKIKDGKIEEIMKYRDGGRLTCVSPLLMIFWLVCITKTKLNLRLYDTQEVKKNKQFS